MTTATDHAGDVMTLEERQAIRALHAVKRWPRDTSLYRRTACRLHIRLGNGRNPFARIYPPERPLLWAAVWATRKLHRDESLIELARNHFPHLKGKS